MRWTSLHQSTFSHVFLRDLSSILQPIQKASNWSAHLQLLFTMAQALGTVSGQKLLCLFNPSGSSLALAALVQLPHPQRGFAFQLLSTAVQSGCVPHQKPFACCHPPVRCPSWPSCSEHFSAKSRLDVTQETSVPASFHTRRSSLPALFYMMLICGCQTSALPQSCWRE